MDFEEAIRDVLAIDVSGAVYRVLCAANERSLSRRFTLQIVLSISFVVTDILMQLWDGTSYGSPAPPSTKPQCANIAAQWTPHLTRSGPFLSLQPYTSSAMLRALKRSPPHEQRFEKAIRETDESLFIASPPSRPDPRDFDE